MTDASLPKQCSKALLLLLFMTMVIFSVNANVLHQQNDAAIESAPTLTFCYEDKQLLPYYAGSGRNIPALPGATIEHLRRAAEQSGLKLALVRLPWLRCLQKLESNNVDALIAAIDAGRAHYTVYPLLPDGSPDSSKAINQLGLCLAHRFDNPLPQKLKTADQAFTLARPLGYRPIPFPANTVLVDAHSPQHALQLVVEQRVDATTVLCQLNGLDARERHLNLLPIQLIYPPLHVSDGYLMFSKGFYQRYPQFAAKLWQALPQTLDKARYLYYLNYSE
jgi:polar amino acid transport system substrate-binding protein